uniref:Truncated large T antigen n=1 Tax=Merkel cell polyomavirus TaxID=493803 RepID=A0A0D3LRZ4_9POLY|nr:truncated large T antigen [Merkel cell polyomavirus]
MDLVLNRKEREALCKLLEISPNCYGNIPLMKAAFKRSCLKHHPDKGGNPVIMMELNTLWSKFQQNIHKLRSDFSMFDEEPTSSSGSSSREETTNSGRESSTPNGTSVPRNSSRTDGTWEDLFCDESLFSPEPPSSSEEPEEPPSSRSSPRQPPSSSAEEASSS